MVPPYSLINSTYANDVLQTDSPKSLSNGKSYIFTLMILQLII